MPENVLTSFGYYVMMPTWYESACRQTYLEGVRRYDKERAEKEKADKEKNKSLEEAVKKN
ncbi:hypothetical protein HZA33_04165 [Candidatus Pacearchaeota archaeon]|nr:hypothetical protein [Candidatus Pacearchaeota archaeon]